MTGGLPSPALYKNRRGVGALYPKFTAATSPSDIPIRSRERLADGKLRRCCCVHHDDPIRSPRPRTVPVEARGLPLPTPTFAAAGRPLLRPGVRRRHHRHDDSELKRFCPAVCRRRIWSRPTPLSLILVLEIGKNTTSTCYCIIRTCNHARSVHRARSLYEVKNFRT